MKASFLSVQVADPFGTLNPLQYPHIAGATGCFHNHQGLMHTMPQQQAHSSNDQAGLATLCKHTYASMHPPTAKPRITK